MKEHLSGKQNFFKSLFEQPAGKAFSSIVRLLQNHQENDAVSNAIILLFKAVLWADGSPDDREIECFEKILGKNYTPFQISQLTSELKSPRKVNIDEECGQLAGLSEEQKLHFLESLISLGLADENYNEPQRRIVSRVAALLNIPENILDSLEEKIEQENITKKRLLRSSAGIIVALIVIGIFILTATLLKSVIFGLILAYVFLPLEKFYERKLESKGMFSGIFKLFSGCAKPFKAISGSMRRKKSLPEYTVEEIARRQRRKLIAKATTLTVASFVLLMVVIAIIFFTVSANYLAGIGSSVKSWLKTNIKTEEIIQGTPEADTVPGTEPTPRADETVSRPAATPGNVSSGSYLRQTFGKLETYKPKLEKMPLINWCVEVTAKILNDPKTQKELLTEALKRSGGVFSFATGILSSFISFLLNTLLAIFFFSLFLSKMAEFIKDNRNQQKLQSEYLVRIVFNSKWLPVATENTVAQAQEIISQVINKLKTWLRGYFTLICVDTVVYTSVFLLLGVPYAFLLALIAAFGLLLPYIGPIASAALTMLVTLAVGDDVTMMQLILIACAYIVENGIVEQLFLYPAVIGESLGLTTLETIIVVLLGGIFAGITGMIFAIPAASVLKYLIPKIYSCMNS
ncbi:MAG: AI-2E family transporter [Victivallales bacterium]|nr:AI-2E family transporter [Victivallales bacterium]